MQHKNIFLLILMISFGDVHVHAQNLQAYNIGTGTDVSLDRIALQEDSILYFCGPFNTFDGQESHYFAGYNTASQQDLLYGTQIPDEITDFLPVGNNVYLAINDSLMELTNARDSATAQLVFIGVCDDEINTIDTFQNQLVISGPFTKYNGFIVNGPLFINLADFNDISNFPYTLAGPLKYARPFRGNLWIIADNPISGVDKVYIYDGSTLWDTTGGFVNGGIDFVKRSPAALMFSGIGLGGSGYLARNGAVLISAYGVEKYPSDPSTGQAYAIASVADTSQTVLLMGDLAINTLWGGLIVNLVTEEVSLFPIPEDCVWAIHDCTYSSGGRLYLGGYIYSTENYDLHNICYLDYPVGVGNISTQKIAYFPNPAQEVVHVIGLNGRTELSLYNLSGQIVRAATSDANGEATLPVADLPAGLYLLRDSQHRYMPSKLTVLHE